MRLILSVTIIAVSFFSGGCSNREAEKLSQQDQKGKLSVHGTAPVQVGNQEKAMVTVIKKQPLKDFSPTPVGTVIDDYRFFTKKEWSESENSKGTVYVDVTGWMNSNTLDSKSIKNGISARGIQIKFAIYENGAFGVAMVSRVEAKTDGKVYAYPLEDRKGILDRIYANKEISF